MKEAVGLNSKMEERLEKNVVFILEESSLSNVAFVEKNEFTVGERGHPWLIRRRGLEAGGECVAQGVGRAGQRQGHLGPNGHAHKKYLHVVLMMNLGNFGFTSRTASSPAIFNRCLIDWFGSWDGSTFKFISDSRLKHVDVIEKAVFKGLDNPVDKRNKLSNIYYQIYKFASGLNDCLRSKHKPFNFLSSSD